MKMRRTKATTMFLLYVAGVSEKFRRIFSNHNIPVSFRPFNTLRQKLVHPKDKTPTHKHNNVVHAVQCNE